MFTLIAFISAVLVLPTLSAVVIARLLIRQGKVSEGLVAGLGIVVGTLVLTLGLINNDVAQCVLRCQQTYGADSGFCHFLCSGQSPLRPGEAMVIAVINVNAFLLCSLFLTRVYKQPVSLLNAFLLSAGTTALIVGITFFSIEVPIEINQVVENGQTYFSSLGLGLSGILLLFIAAHRMRRAHNIY